MRGKNCPAFSSLWNSLENLGKKVNREERMYKTSALVFAVAALVALGASGAQAKTINAGATIKGKATISAFGPSNECPEGYADQCPNFGAASCACANFEDGTITGSLGKGTVSLDVTIDESEEVTNNIDQGCQPIFGELDVAITDPKKATGTVELDLNGTLCRHLTKNAPDVIEGGFALVGCFSPSGDNHTSASGYGEVDGTVDSSGNVVLKLKGPITSPGDSCI